MSFSTFSRRLLSIALAAVLTTPFVSAQVVLTDMGRQGTFKKLKGQVVDRNGYPIIGAKVHILKLRSERETLINADDNGIYSPDLGRGSYQIMVEAGGFNPLTFIVKVDKKKISTSNKYIVVVLAPGCGGGGDLRQVTGLTSKE